MSYKHYPELINIQNQVSVNARFQSHSRSGDNLGNGSEMLDFYACSPSPEEVLIQKEEIGYNSSSALRALKITKKYIKTVFSTIEIEFIKGLITTDKTPAKIADALGKKYYDLGKSIYDKFEATKNKLLSYFYKSGYYCRSTIEFIPKLLAYIKHNENNRLWIERNSERRKASKRKWYEAHYKKMTDEEYVAYKNALKNARREAKLATLPEDKREAQLKTWEYMDAYYAKHKQRLSG